MSCMVIPLDGLLRPVIVVGGLVLVVALTSNDAVAGQVEIMTPDGTYKEADVSGGEVWTKDGFEGYGENGEIMTKDGKPVFYTKGKDGGKAVLPKYGTAAEYIREMQSYQDDNTKISLLEKALKQKQEGKLKTTSDELVQIYYELGKAYDKTGKQEEAKETYHNLIILNPLHDKANQANKAIKK